MTRDSRSVSGGAKADWSKFDQTLAEARAGFADLSPDDIENTVDQAVAAIRRSVREALSPQCNDG